MNDNPITAKPFSRIFLFLFVVAFFLSCNQEDEIDPPFEPAYLVSYESMASYSKQEIIAAFSDGGTSFPGIDFLLQHDVDALRITYHTVGVNGEAVVASGALLIPATNGRYPLLSFQHGTINDPSEAPSATGSFYTELGAFFSSAGFITALPDYLGYGASSQINHPYQHRQSLATATRDMIRAAYEYFEIEASASPSNKLFLTGYSQGGYATMAALKLMQEEHSSEFNVSAATVGAGPYNKTATMQYLLTMDEEHEDINTYIWVLDTYNKVYPELNRPYSFYFNEPWAGIIEEQGIHAAIESNPMALLTDEFRQGLLQGTDSEMMAVLADNDIFSWKPEMPLQLYHGTSDSLVPFFNSQSAYDSMTSLGASAIELKPVEGGTHISTFPDYMIGTFTFFFPLLAK